MAEESRSRLGRGLAALIGDGSNVEPEALNQRKAPIEFLRPNPRNPRSDFSEEHLVELADSIRERGIIQPIVVRSLPNLINVYEIVAGERRWRAAQRAGLHEVPIVIVDIDDRQSLEFAIIENVQRSDLNAIEEASGYKRLAEEFGYNQQDLAKILGKSRSHIANTIRLLNLPDEVRAMVVRREISAGHARAMLTFDDPVKVAVKAVNEGLTVRDVERLSQNNHAESPKKAASDEKTRDPNTEALEKLLSDLLGLGVKIRSSGEAGDVKIKFNTLDQLDLLCKRLQG